MRLPRPACKRSGWHYYAGLIGIITHEPNAGKCYSYAVFDDQSRLSRVRAQGDVHNTMPARNTRRFFGSELHSSTIRRMKCVNYVGPAASDKLP